MIFPLKSKLPITTLASRLDQKNEELVGNLSGSISHFGFPDKLSAYKVLCFISSYDRASQIIKNLADGSVIVTTPAIFSKYFKETVSRYSWVKTLEPRNTFANLLFGDTSFKTSKGFREKQGKLFTKDITIGPNTVIANKVKIDKNVSIGPNCSIGYGGFGFYYDRLGNKKRFPHFGSVHIGENVEIDANVVIDRGAFSYTLIGKNCKIGSLVHIAHNVCIEENVILTPHSKLCGSVILRKNTYISPGVIIRQSVEIGEGSIVGMGAIVTKNFPPFSLIYGNPGRLIRTLKPGNYLPA